MARLPQPGKDSGTWGDILNDYLSQSHKTDGTLKDNSVGTSQLKDNAVTASAIADSTITSSQLATDITDKLSKADSAIQASDLDAQTAAEINDSTSATAGALAGTYVARNRIILADKLESWGHSYAFGQGATNNSQRYSAVAADLLGIGENMAALAGSRVCSQWVGWLAVLRRPEQPAGRFVAPSALRTVMWGINDLSSTFSPLQPLSAIEKTFDLCVSRWRAGCAAYQETDASFAFPTGTWATITSTSTNSGTGYKNLTSATGTYTVTTPVEFPGGTVAIAITSPPNATEGGVHTATYQGKVVATVDARTSVTSTERKGYVLRITDVLPGSQTITVSVSSVTTGSGVDSWWWESPVDIGPLVVLVAQPYCPDYTAYGATDVQPTDALVDGLNSILSSLAERFGKRVLIADQHLAQMNHTEAYFASDKLHPNTFGHAVIAQSIIAAIDNANLTVVRGQSEPSTQLFDIWAASFPNAIETYRYCYAGSRVRNTSPIETGTAGSKYVVTGWICTASGTPGTWLECRSLTGN